MKAPASMGAEVSSALETATVKSPVKCGTTDEPRKLEVNMTGARLSSAAIELMRVFPPILALLSCVCGCATSNATDEDSGSPIDSSLAKDSSLRDDATPDMDSASNDSSIGDGDISDASDSSIDDSSVTDGAADDGAVDGGCTTDGSTPDASGADAGAGCKGVICPAFDKCCNNIASVNYGKCELISCPCCCM